MQKLDETFDSRSWQRARTLFDAWVDLPEAQRHRRLQSLARDEPQVAPLLRHLLDNDSQSDDFLERPILPWTAPESDPTALEGSSLGAYRLLRCVGRGGAGVVYLAEREHADFQQQVAIKILHRTFHDDARRRFHLERRILARLQHPAIARLIDGGSTEDGQPFVVMEWVDGEPITAFCATQQLDLRQRLRLFRRVGEAVLHAHRNLVVHRDLKPSNILVSRDGHPKLLDFGIAKLLGDEPTHPATAGDGAIHDLESRWLSPGYASPEQVLGTPISTASDVYSLGLLLYEMLVGASPQPRDPAQLVQFARQGTIPPASQEPDNTLPFRRQLRGDLDAIIGQATARSVEGRYGSIEPLLGDIDRFLDGRPVDARRAGPLYRAGKFARRHLAATGISAILALVVFMFTAHSVVQAQRLERERDEAERRRVAAENLSDVLVETLELLDPGSGRERDDRTKAILDQGRAGIQKRFAADPLLEAELLTSLGSVYRRLAYYDESGDMLERAMTLRRDAATADADAARQRLAETQAEIGRLWLDRGDLTQAEEQLRQALERFESLRRPPPMARSRGLKALAEVRERQVDLQGAEELLLRSTHLAAEGGASDLDRAEISLALAKVLTLDNRVDEALALMGPAIEIHRRALGRDHPRVANASHDLGTVLFNSGRFASAAEPLQEAYDLRRRYYGDSHPNTVASLANLSGVYGMTGQHRLAVSLTLRVLELDRQNFGQDHPYVAMDLAGLGLSYWQVGQTEEAIEALQESLAINRRVLEPDSLNVAISLDNLGLVLTDARRFEEAEAAHLEALAVRRQRPASEAWHPGDSLLNLAQLELARKRPTSAAAYLQQAGEAFAHGLPDPERWQGHRLKSIEGELQMLDGADDPGLEETLKASFEGVLEGRGPYDRFTRDANDRLVRWLESQGRGEDAEQARSRIIVPEPLDATP